MKKSRGFNRSVFIIALTVVIALLFLLSNGCTKAYAQSDTTQTIYAISNESVVPNRAEFTTILKEKYFRMSRDSISVSHGFNRMNNLSHQEAVEKTGLPNGWENKFVQDKQLYLVSVIWIIKHWQLTSNGYIYNLSIAEYIARSGKYKPDESYVVNFPTVNHIHSNHIERLLNDK